MHILASQVRAFAGILTWRSSFDIALIAMGFFLLYHSLRASGTWKIVVGVLITAAVFVTASVFDLRGIEWIFSNLSDIALIGLIVIFQPEIRKIFERAASLRRTDLGTQESGLSTLLADSAFALAEQRRGAILALPGKEPIKPWVSEGLPLDATPTLPLLLSLFDPHSPGHDGAAILENGRVASFAVRLPLSKTKTLSEDLGTRHHAALGLAEVTDALVIAVSEERGLVTLFSRGRLQHVQDRSQLAERVLSHWRETGSYELTTQYRRKRWSLIGETAVSLGAALLFWTTVVMSGSRMIEIGLTVPIEYTATPPNVALVGEKPSEIKIQVAGPAAELDRVNPSQLPVTIDLAQATTGRRRFLVTAENLRLPRGVKLLATDPASIEVSLRAIAQKDADVRPQVVGTLPRGLQLAAVEVNPPILRVLSPVDDEIGAQVALAPVDLATIRETTTLTREVVAPPGVQPLGDQWPEVKVRIVVKGKLAKRPGKRR